MINPYEGLLVNQHLGEAKTLYIYRQTPKGFQFVEEREAPVPGTGDFRWIRLANTIKDCRAILVAGVGGNPSNILQHSGVRVIQMTGLIDEVQIYDYVEALEYSDAHLLAAIMLIFSFLVLLVLYTLNPNKRHAKT